MKRHSIKIPAIGTYLPVDRQLNSKKAEKFGYDSNFLNNKLGFTSVALKGKEETTLDMCVKAFENLKQKIELNVKDIQLITVISQNPTVNIPHTSAMLHNILELDKNCMTFDISQGCSGFCHAIQIVHSLMESLGYNNALIFTCDTYRDIIDENDHNVSMIFGDGGAVTLLSRDINQGYSLVDATFGTALGSYDCLICDNGLLKMDGRRVFNYAAQEVPKSIQLILERNEMSKEDINLYLLHQGSKFIVDSLTKILGVSPHKTEFSSSKYGNTVSSSIPILLSNHLGNHAKTNVILSGFGVGFTWGTCLLKHIKNEEE